MKEKISDITKKIGYKAEKKIKDLLKNGGYDKMKEYGFGLFKDEKLNSTIDPFPKIIKETSYIIEKRNYKLWLLNYKYNNIAGCAKIHFVNTYNRDKPTIVFHHGFLGTKHLTHLPIITTLDTFKLFNVISIALNAHQSLTDIRDKGMNNFLNAVLSVAGSVLAYEESLKFHRLNSDKKSIATGVSLGGIVTSWHYFLFNTADIYIPIAAFPDVGELLLQSQLKGLVYNFEQLEHNKSYLDCFNVPNEIKDKKKEKIFPILATKDDTVSYDVAKEFWKGYNTYELESGHFSLITYRHEINKFMMQRYEETTRDKDN